MFKTFTYSFVLAAFVSSSCVAMEGFDLRPRRHSVLYDGPWEPNFVKEPPVFAALLSSCSSYGVDEAVCAKIWSYHSNPLGEVIEAVLNKPVAFGQNVGNYKFRHFERKNPLAERYRRIYEREDSLRLEVTFTPETFSIEGLHPSFIRFYNIEETVVFAQGNKNIVTDAAMFVAKKVAEHERRTGFGPHDRLANRSVAIPTDYGIYYAAKSCLYDSEKCRFKEICCLSQEKFDDMSRHF